MRVRAIRIRREVVGVDGLPVLADALGLPGRTWAGHGSGVAPPELIVLTFNCLTRTSPRWLLTAAGEPFSPELVG